jgi:transposase
MEYIGIDVHKRESQLCMLRESGERVECRIRTDRERFAHVLGGRAAARIVVEASTESEWVARCLEALGHEVIVADPNFAPMYATRSRRVKTDVRDARALAEACQLGAYRRAHRTSDAQRTVRAQLVVREALVRTRTRYIAVVRALLRSEGVRVPGLGSARTFTTRVAALAVPATLARHLAPLVTLLDQLSAAIATADRGFAQHATAEPIVQRLTTVPSVGPITAAAFRAAIDDVTRFRDAHQVAAYFGVVPRERSSGDGHYRGRITKSGRPDSGLPRRSRPRSTAPAPRVPGPESASHGWHERAWINGRRQEPHGRSAPATLPYPHHAPTRTRVPVSKRE